MGGIVWHAAGGEAVKQRLYRRVRLVRTHKPYANCWWALDAVLPFWGEGRTPEGALRDLDATLREVLAEIRDAEAHSSRWMIGHHWARYRQVLEARERVL